MVDPDRLLAAYETARCDLLAESTADGHWIGRVSSSPLSTATAISALAIVDRHAPTAGGRIVDEQRECALSELIIGSLRWLAKHQNSDGGWGDTDRSPSNIAATMVVRAAFALTCTPAGHPGLLERTDAYIESQGGVKGLKQRYGKTLAAPVLANYALAGLVDWKQVPALPFEATRLPWQVTRLLRLPLAGYSIPMLVAVGQARHFSRKPANPIARIVRDATRESSLVKLEELQPSSGGFLESTPLTSFVVMCLAAIHRADHAVVRRGVEFLLAGVRPDGSWPLGANLAIWNTTLAAGVLAAAGEDPCETHCWDWLLGCQLRTRDGQCNEIGGWAWTDLPGGVPNADDTASALLALRWAFEAGIRSEEIASAARAGVRFLLALQNSDGGWPLFGRGSGGLPFDTSGADMTARVLRALKAWQPTVLGDAQMSPTQRAELDRRISRALDGGLRYLAAVQARDGAWIPLRFGNPHRAAGENPVYGTAQVLLALRDLGRLDVLAARRALDWLLANQRADGSFGADVKNGPASIEETAIAAQALCACGDAPAQVEAATRAVGWLSDAVETNRHTESAPLGRYFGKVWYYERLYPLIWTVAALGPAARKVLAAKTPRPAMHASQP
jgi:squalene-hopene/tetraprenyl-beta-curcumene cyclase